MPEIEGQDPAAIETPEPQEGQTPETTPPAGGKSYPESYVKGLRTEAAGYRTRLAELERKEQERADAEKSELEKVLSRAERAEQDLRTHQLESAKLRAALRHGLHEDDYDFIHADTVEAIEEKAEKYAAKLKAASPGTTPPGVNLAMQPRPLGHAGNPGVDDPVAAKKAREDDLRHRMLGKRKPREVSA